MAVYFMSRYKYPTRVVCVGNKGTLHTGRKDARADLEREIGRSLHPNTKVTKRGGNWRFTEPRFAQP